MNSKDNFINCFEHVATLMNQSNEDLQDTIIRSCNENGWYTPDEIQRMFLAISTHYCDRTKLTPWLDKYPATKTEQIKTVGLIAAGNIPLVAFHDILCILAFGYHCVIKLSEKDKALYIWLVNQINTFDPKLGEKISFVDRLKNYDAVIATGSNLSANQFKYYFQHVPHLIRSHRNGIAILHGDETEEDFIQLGKDILYYYGNGCRNVSKLYVPEGYNFSPLIKTIDANFSYVNEHTKFKNNYDYNFAICIMNQYKFLQGETLLYCENSSIPSPIGIINFEYYKELSELISSLDVHRNSIQCTMSNAPIKNWPTITLGQSQAPSLDDFADGINTMEFLSKL